MTEQNRRYHEKAKKLVFSEGPPPGTQNVSTLRKGAWFLDRVVVKSCS